MDTIVQAAYGIRLALLLVVVVLAVVLLVRGLRPRAWSSGRAIALAAVEAVAVVVLILLTGVSVSWLWIGALFVLGAVAGFFAGRASRFSDAGGKPVLKRTPVAVPLTALAFVLAALTLLFGSAQLFGYAVLLLAFAAGTMAGQVIAEQMAAARVAPAAGPVQVSAPGEATQA